MKCDGNHGSPPCADPNCWRGDEDLRRNFLEHVVKAPSQYDDLCRQMATEILRLRDAVDFAERIQRIREILGVDEAEAVRFQHAVGVQVQPARERNRWREVTLQQVEVLRALGRDQQRGAAIPNFAEQLWDVADTLSAVARGEVPRQST